MSAVIVGRDVVDLHQAPTADDECLAYDETDDLLCMLIDGHDGPHWDPFDRVTWKPDED